MSDVFANCSLYVVLDFIIKCYRDYCAQHKSDYYDRLCDVISITSDEKMLDVLFRIAYKQFLYVEKLRLLRENLRTFLTKLSKTDPTANMCWKFWLMDIAKPVKPVKPVPKFVTVPVKFVTILPAIPAKPVAMSVEKSVTILATKPVAKPEVRIKRSEHTNVKPFDDAQLHARSYIWNRKEAELWGKGLKGATHVFDITGNVVTSIKCNCEKCSKNPVFIDYSTLDMKLVRKNSIPNLICANCMRIKHEEIAEYHRARSVKNPMTTRDEAFKSFEKAYK